MANLIPYIKSSIIKRQKSAIIKADKFLNTKTKSSIIEPQKSAIVKADKFLNTKSTKVNENSVKPKQSENSSEDIILQIEKKVIKIDKLLKDSFALKKKQQKKVRIKGEQKEFEDREKELEKKKPKKEKGVNLPTPPKMGFLDWIKNFVFNTILGFLTVRLMKFLPTLLKIYPVIVGAGEFLINVGGNLLNSLVSFVDWGYNAVDATSGFIKSIGGEGLSKVFDNFMGAIDNVLEFAVMAALVSSGGGDESDSGGFGGKGGKKGFDSTGRRVGTKVQQRYERRFGKDKFVDRFGTKNLKNVAQGARRGAFQQGTRNAFVGLAGKGGAKSILKFVRPLTNKLPIIGGLLNFGLSVALGEDPGRAAFKAIGSTLVGALGAAIGSLAFGVGGIIGGIIGGIGGDALGGALYDMFFKGKKPTQKQGKTNKLAGGGRPVPTRGGKSSSSTPKRTLKKKKSTRTLTFTPRKIQPGRSAGGEAKVQSVFPNPEKAWWDPLGVFTGKKQEQEQQPQQKKPKGKTANPQEFLIKSNDIFGRAKGSAGKMISGFATYIIKSLLGDTPDELDYLNLSKGLNSFMQGIFEPGTLGFSGGGEVDARQFFEGKDYTKVIAKSVKESGSKEVDTIIRNLKNEMSLRPVGKEEMREQNQKAPDAQDMGEGAGVQVSSDSEDFWLLATAAMFENSNPQGSADVAQVIYNRTQYPAWNAPTIRKAILNPGQFQPVRQYGGTAAWAAIKTKQDALRFSKSHGKTQEQLERVAAALLDKSKQRDARSFVGPRDSFRSDAYEKANNHLANDTEKSRHGHTFGFEPGGAMIGKFKAGQLSAAQVNANVTGSVDQKGLPPLPPTGTMRGQNYGDSREGGKRRHAGQDFDAPTNGTFYSRIGGEVIYSANVGGGYGNVVDIYNKKLGVTERIAEGTTNLVKLGQTVSAGTPVQQGTHQTGVFHYEIRRGKATGSGSFEGTIDPKKFLSGSRFHGGEITKEGVYNLHKGEVVIDFDTRKLFGIDLLMDLNSVENKSQLIAKAPSIIEKLKSISGYTDYENPNQEPQYIVIKSPPEIRYVSTGSGGKNVFIGGGVNTNMVSFDIEQKLSCMA